VHRLEIKQVAVMKSRISVIIPAYNEQDTVSRVIEGIRNELPGAYICVVDNNSRDSTGAVASKKIRELKLKGTVIFEGRKGKANAVRKAFSMLDSDIYVLIDADCTYNPKDVKKLINAVSSGSAEMAVGDRLSKGGYRKQNKRVFHNFGNKFVRSIINIIFKSSLNDIMSGYRVFSRKFVKNFPIFSEGFEIETEMTLHALDKRFRIIEIPVDYCGRPQGSKSKLNTIKDGLLVIRTIFRIFRDYKPFQFFSLPGLFCFLSGVLIGVPVLSEYIRFKYIYKIPSAILAMGLIIVSLLLFSIGLILDTVSRHHKFDYEYHLLRYSSEKPEKTD
jgi:glycosyltransferase involved in cell wall biosynthesis